MSDSKKDIKEKIRIAVLLGDKVNPKYDPNNKDPTHYSAYPTQMAAARMAYAIAQGLLPKFEREFPDDKRSRKALEALKRWIHDPSEKNREKVKEAAKVAQKAAIDAGADASAITAGLAATTATDPTFVDLVAYTAVHASDYTAHATEDYAKREHWQREKLKEIIEHLDDPEVESAGKRMEE